MRLLTCIVMLAAVGCSQPRSGVPGRDTARSGSPELAARADSLERLDLEREARAAIALGDLRFLAVCGFACIPVGVPLDSVRQTSDSLAVRGDSIRTIPGTSDAIVNQDIERLNNVARVYASRYNSVIWERRKELRKK